LSELKPQAIANTAWAPATVTYRNDNDKLLAALVIAAERRLGELNTLNVANTDQ